MGTAAGFRSAPLRALHETPNETEIYHVSREGRVTLWLVPRGDRSVRGGLLEMHLQRVHPESPGREADSCAGRPAVEELVLKADASMVGACGLLTTAKLETMRVCDTAAWELAMSLIEFEGRRDIDRWAASSLLEMLCARLQELLPRRANSGGRCFEDWQMSQLAEVLAEESVEDVSVAAAAARCKLSVCQFSRTFKTMYGMPLHRFLMHERVKRARQLLAETDAPIAQIALGCGFADQSSFTRRFSTVTGVPPGVFRRHARGGGYFASSADALTGSDAPDQDWR